MIEYHSKILFYNEIIKCVKDFKHYILTWYRNSIIPNINDVDNIRVGKNKAFQPQKYAIYPLIENKR